MTFCDGFAVFALPPSEALGRAVAAALGIELAPYELRRFEDGEHKLRPLVDVRARDSFVIGSLYGDASESVNDRLCRLLFFVATLRDAGAARVTVVAPYLCYARKDRRTNARDPVTARYVAQLVEAVGAYRVMVVDVHNQAAFENAFRIPTEHLSASALFAARCRGLGERPLAVVSPDPGGFHRAEALRDALAAGRPERVELALVGKHRRGGVVGGEGFAGDVRGRVAVILDDMIVTGTTLVRAAEACRARGAVATHAMATHGMFAAGASAALVTPVLDSIVVTDTIAVEQAPPGLRDRVTVLSVAALVAAAIAEVRASVRPIVSERQ